MKFLLPICALIALSGCDALFKAQEYAAEAAARGVEAECLAGTVVRKQNFCAVNEALARRQTVNRAMPLDCDGDGMSDDLGSCLPE